MLALLSRSGCWAMRSKHVAYTPTIQVPHTPVHDTVDDVSLWDRRLSQACCMPSVLALMPKFRRLGVQTKSGFEGTDALLWKASASGGTTPGGSTPKRVSFTWGGQSGGVTEMAFSGVSELGNPFARRRCRTRAHTRAAQVVARQC